LKKSLTGSSDVLVSFRIKKSSDDDKIRDLFSDCKTNKERANITKAALNFYVENKEKLDDIKNIREDIEKIRSTLDDIKSSGMQAKGSRNSVSTANHVEDKESQVTKDKWSEGALKMFDF